MRCLQLCKLIGNLPTVQQRLLPPERRWKRIHRRTTHIQLLSTAIGRPQRSRHIATEVQKQSLNDFGLDNDTDTFLPGITVDPFFKELNLPKRCIGCGALFQSADASKPGYVDAGILSDFGARGAAKVPRVGGVEVERVPDGVQVDKCDDGRFQRLKRRAVCRRCYRLQRVDLQCEVDSHRQSAAGVSDSRMSTERIVTATPSNAGGVLQMPEEAERRRTSASARITTAPEVISNMTRRLKSDGVVLYLVDITNVEATALPELYIAIRNKAMEVIWIANKVDVLPHRTDLPEVKRWLRSMVRHIGNAKNSDVFMVSSTKGTGFDALERRLKEFIKVGDARPIYIVGAVNVGKSTFVNRFLSYISYGDAGTLQMKRGIGGATRSVIPGTTLEFIEFGLFGGFKLIDTPGIPVAATVTQLLRRPVDMVAVALNKTMDTPTVRLDAGQSLLVGAMARIDLVEGSAASVRCYIGSGVTLHVCRSVAAADVMRNKAGNAIFPPHTKDDYELLGPMKKYRLTVNCNGAIPVDDIVIPGLGWLSPTGVGPKVIEIYAPKGLDVLRRPAMIRQQPKRVQKPYVLRRRGKLKKLMKMRREIVEKNVHRST
ncbi:hypothetical protein, conserved [Babesia bigemina]|uniref:Uncharacterized protein n=1 Tax=Babesia bigemina TaxID=5866 RepID=A0A061DEU2_BABBI|nr:LOW QUALITY PROTEIN: hypothetical protein, conserved [Babesia bigemina]CDR97875.1 hypothetical protein, conserved [Babesia bigemina]|eukprot:XP_012770061.1 LOW QUALITY PROTEIN: hypothetical protein, conserved [Babesia bigemina]